MVDINSGHDGASLHTRETSETDMEETQFMDAGVRMRWRFECCMAAIHILETTSLVLGKHLQEK